MIIIGAGMAGLLAAGMLRNQVTEVQEAQPGLPNNHSAVLRFRSTAVADALGIEFKAVKAVKGVHAWCNPIADAMAYSTKTNGSATLRSILTASSEPVTRFIAPPDLIQQMADRVSAPIRFGQKARCTEFECVPIISTIPMPALMDALDWHGARPEFRSVSGVNLTCELENTEAYCSLYFPDPKYPVARASITGNQMVAECYTPDGSELSASGIASHAREVMSATAGLMGVSPDWVGKVNVKEQKYAKILPIDEETRRAFIIWASEQMNVYSLGRYATWRPGLLMDDVVNDVRVIQRLINNRGEAYPHKLKGLTR